jgi:hypothetical protein
MQEQAQFQEPAGFQQRPLQRISIIALRTPRTSVRSCASSVQDMSLEAMQQRIARQTFLCRARCRFRVVKWCSVWGSPGARKTVSGDPPAAKERYPAQTLLALGFASQEPNSCWLPSQASSPPVICKCGPRKTRFNTLDVDLVFLCFGVCRSCRFKICRQYLDQCKKAIVLGADGESKISLPCLCCDFCQCDCDSVASGQAGRREGTSSIATLRTLLKASKKAHVTHCAHAGDPFRVEA